MPPRRFPASPPKGANPMSSKCFLCLLTVAAMLCALSTPAQAAATITIVNGNAAGVGFNDPTPTSPVGGNAGITLGGQRLIAFQEAASIWGASLNSSVPITILATMEALSCTATSAVLGSAGATEVWSAATFPFSDTWYHFALANKLAGVDLDPTTPQIRARFNSNLGQPTCLSGSPFYLGLDNSHGLQIDLVMCCSTNSATAWSSPTWLAGRAALFSSAFQPRGITSCWI